MQHGTCCKSATASFFRWNIGPASLSSAMQWPVTKQIHTATNPNPAFQSLAPHQTTTPGGAMNQHKSKKQLLFTRKSCVVATEFALAMMAARFAFAQASPPAVKIEVTRSRIPLQQNVESTSPSAVISAEDIKIEGVRNIENLLQNMPQVFADQGSTVSNGSSGTATVDLRNL